MIPVVAGSIPVVHPINFPHKSMAYGYFTEKYCSFGQFLDSFVLRPARSGGGVPPTSVLLKVQALRSLNEPQSHLRWF